MEQVAAEYLDLIQEIQKEKVKQPQNTKRSRLFGKFFFRVQRTIRGM